MQRCTKPVPFRFLVAAAIAVSLSACDWGDDDDAAPPATASRIQVDVERTTHGVPHVRANDFRSLGYGLAYAYAQDNVCMFADSLLTVRGERSAFFGGEARPQRRSGDDYGAASGFMDLKNEDSDFFFKGYLDLEQLRAGYAAGGAELLDGFVEGYNRYLKDYANKLPAACAGAKWVRPMTFDDMMLVIAEKALHASGQVFAKDFVAAGRAPGATTLAKASARQLDPSTIPAMLSSLRNAALALQALGVPFDGRLGDYQVEPRNGVRIPLHGGNGNQEGTYGSLTMRSGLTSSGYVGAHWGQSYIQTVTFDEQGPVAQGMLTYNQSTDPASPWYADQTRVYSRKEWPVLPFTQERIKADPNYTSITLRE